MTRTVRLEMANPGMVSGNTNVKSVITVWEEATAYFESATPRGLRTNREANLWCHVTIDTSDLLDFFSINAALAANDAEGEVQFVRRLAYRKSLGQRQFGGHVDLIFQTVNEHDPEVTLEMVGRFIQTWFLAMNLALPGSFTTFRAIYPNEKDEDCPPPNLHGATLETAYEHSRKRAWPPIRQLSFVQVWNWLQQRFPYDTHIAHDPLDRSLFTILRICEPELHDTDRILLIAQALEGLLLPGKEQVGTLLRQRLELVLGVPPTKRNWFSRFYGLRSRIAHGDYPLLRPGDYLNEDRPEVEEYVATFFEPTDEAVAVLVSLLQDLAATNTSRYLFEQKIHRQ